MASVLQKLRNSSATRVCSACKQATDEATLVRELFLCPHCGHLMPIPARARIELLVDHGTFQELFGEEVFTNPIDFPQYPEKFAAAKAKSGENEGVICGVAQIVGCRTCLFVMNPEFMMGSMGTVVGDRITALFEYATLHRLPVVGYTVSGGARMQEGVLSLMQMAKVSAAVRQHSDAGLLYIAGLTDPTGHVLGLMPHPEAFHHATNHPGWTRGETAVPGTALFANAVRYLREHPVNA